MGKNFNDIKSEAPGTFEPLKDCGAWSLLLILTAFGGAAERWKTAQEETDSLTE